MTALKGKVEEYNELFQGYEDALVLWELGKEEDDNSTAKEVAGLVEDVLAKLEALEIEVLFSDKYDHSNAILEIHPGAGGTESQDWAEMLMRMYTRWAEKRGCKVEIMDYLPGEEAGVKSVTLLISGDKAYGYLKGEKGVHRLVRISPFDASGRRHTSFTAVDILPEIDEDNNDINIDPKDLKIDTYRAGGAGGQHVNKTDSAVRITHLPTGIVVQCQNERSQISNRVQAMKLLKGKLFELRRKEQAQELQSIKGEQQDIAWGSQIRSYVFHPYSLVKDHRTNEEIGNVQAVMDGEIDKFITAYLKTTAARRG